MEWQSFLRTLAPTVASALLGPAAGLAISAIGSILGVPEATAQRLQDAIASGQMTPEQIGKLKELEIQYQNDEKERGFRYAELEFKDRDSARAREMATKDSTNRNLAYIIIGAFIAMVAGTLLGAAKVESVLAGTLVGYLSAKAEQVLAYYFGSSSGSAAKTQLLANSTPLK